MVDSPDTLADALADVSNRRVSLEGEATRLEGQLTNVRQALREATNQESVLRTIIKDRTSANQPPLFEEPTSDTPATSETPALPLASLSLANTDDWANLSRSWVVLAAVAMLAQEKGFASPGDIQELLAARNRDDSRDLIGAALSYLRTKGEVVSLGRAQWGIPVNGVTP